MQPDQSQTNIADFFRPFARTVPSQTVPQKRLSPFADRGEDEDQDEDSIPQARSGWKDPKTPKRAVSFKNATPVSLSNISRIGSTVASLPIRSPATPQNNNATPSKGYQKKLFETVIPSKSSVAVDTNPNQNPSFSFSDISERSQAVVRNGKVVAVRDSDDEDGSDTDSIRSLDDILGRRDRTTNHKGNGLSFDSNSSHENEDEAERIKMLSKFTRGRSVPIVGKEAIWAIHAKERSLKFDLTRILDDHFGDMEAMDKISKARAESDSEDGDDDGLTETDKNLLAQVVLNGGADMDTDDVNRVLSAVERTEALAGDRTFSFFGWRGMTDLRRGMNVQPLPVHAIPDGLWEPGDDEKRSRAFLSGTLAGMAAKGQLARDLLSWTLQQAIKEEQQDLQQSYVKTLQAGSLSWTRLHLTANTIQEIFQDLGAQSDTIRSAGPILLKYHIDREKQNQSSAHLLAALHVLRSVCTDMDMATLSKLTPILMRLSLDETVMSDGHICIQVESFLETLLQLPNSDSSVHVYDRLVSDASQHLRDPLLQAKLLLHVNACGPLATKLRKTLADVFLLGPIVLDPTSRISRVPLEQLNKHINTARGFTITRNPDATSNDYANLTALVGILDVAVGAGNPPALNMDPHSSGFRSQLLKLDTQDSKISQDALKIKDFNADIDALADSIHNIFVSIKDTGASHMRRTEAKDILQAFEYRLLYNVRIGTRRKKHVFDTVRGSARNNTHTNTSKSKSKSNISSTREQLVGLSGSEHRANERSRYVMGRFLGASHVNANSAV